MENPFELDDIEDVRIIFKAKGKHWGIVARESKEDALAERLALGFTLLGTGTHVIIDCALEDVKQKTSCKE